MNRISFPLEFRMRGPQMADLQDALQLLLDRGAILPSDEGFRRELSEALQRERAANIYVDGPNSYVYAQCTPTTARDPNGLPY